MSESFDLIIIGSGPGGYVAAIRGAQLGMKTAIIEKEHLGGICLNWGCIPTKALLRTSEINHLLHNLAEFGLSADNIQFDATKIVKRSRDVADQLSKGIAGLLKKNKVTVFNGYGKIIGKNKINVTDKGKSTELNTKNIIIATGARARILSGFEPDDKFIWTYKEAMTPKAIPKSLIIVGSGAIGVEFASFYRNMGADVTIIEMLDRILPVEDEEISNIARKSFEKQGMKIMTSSNLKSVKKNTKDITVTIEQQGKNIELKAEKLIMAVGIVANTENIGLENTKVKVENNHIVTNEWMQTNEDNIYAIGDVAGAPWLAHKASHEGILCVEKIAGLKAVYPIKKDNIPGCTYCRPQIASVGLTEAKAKAAGYEIKIGKFPFIGNGKAIALGESEGLVKTIFDAKTGELLGAHMIGAEVTELIQGYVIAKTMEGTEAELMHTIFAHPTLSEMMHESVLAAYGKVIHI